jgi:hypothetical protein
MNYLKVVGGVLCFLILASNIWSISSWSEARGVYDDICYLRQAHLFQKLGIRGLDTDIAHNDDGYLETKLKAIGYPAWAGAPCHTFMPAAKKAVIQYPPGTGFVLALFPEGFQVVPLYVSASVIVFGFALLAIFLGGSTSPILLTTGFGCLAVFLMINPSKASYSAAPTMVVCAVVGWLTARLFVKTPPRHSMLLTMLIGFLIGFAVNFRLPNLFLSAGYFLFFGFAFLRSRNLKTFLQGGSFGLAYLVGIAPTLIANAINAGSPFATTYGGDPTDLSPPTIDAGIIWAYLKDMQGILLALASAWVVLIFCVNRGAGIRSVALVTALNLAVNVPFFLTHPTFNPYYALPIAMLSLWSLLFAFLMQSAESWDGRPIRQTAMT